MIKLSAIGTLGKDAEAKKVGESGLIAFSIAVDQSFKKKNGEKVEKTTWVDANLWTDSPALLSYLKKGASVYLEGEPEVRAYASKDGEVKGSLSVRVRELKIVKFANDSAKEAVASGVEEGNDDLPF
jgi:single-strand DNA-binding protein